MGECSKIAFESTSEFELHDWSKQACWLKKFIFDFVGALKVPVALSLHFEVDQKTCHNSDEGLKSRFCERFWIQVGILVKMSILAEKVHFGLFLMQGSSQFCWVCIASWTQKRHDFRRGGSKTALESIVGYAARFRSKWASLLKKSIWPIFGPLTSPVALGLHCQLDQKQVPIGQRAQKSVLRRLPDSGWNSGQNEHLGWKSSFWPTSGPSVSPVALGLHSHLDPKKQVITRTGGAQKSQRRA